MAIAKIMLEIMKRKLLGEKSPNIKVRDCESLRGTSISGKKIGQRHRYQLTDKIGEKENDSASLNEEDMLGFGDKRRAKLEPGFRTRVSVKKIAKHESEPDFRICLGCGRLFKPSNSNNYFCSNCLADREKAWYAIKNRVFQSSSKTSASPIKKYRKIKRLGEGGMSEVWKVRHKNTGMYYALKTILPEMQESKNATIPFLGEASIGIYLHHRNIVPTYHLGCSNGTFYILTDFCRGGSVAALMERRGGKLSLELATWIILQVLQGFDYAHHAHMEPEIQKGFFSDQIHISSIVHRDFKPSNIFLQDLSKHPIAMIADFGIANAFDAAGLSQITKTGRIMGAPVFMPRQQAMNPKYAKPEVDVWAVAASYYNMLTGAFPKNFRPEKDVWETIATESAVPIHDRNGSIPNELAAVIDQALQEEPEIGCKNASDLRKNIISALPREIKNAMSGVL